MIQAEHRPKSSLKRFGPLVKAAIRQETKSFGSTRGGNANGEVLIASFNTHKCVGLDRRFDPHRTALVIKEIGADLIALQEADQRFGDRAGLLDLDWLRRECGLVPVSLSSGHASHGWHGNVVLFRDGLVSSAREIVLPGIEPRGALVVDLSVQGTLLRIVAAHLGLLRRCRARQVEALLDAARPEDNRPTLLMGDLNEWRLGERSALARLAPAFGPLHAAIPSFPSRFPVWALDRILGDPAELISSIALHETPLARIASDHLPIKAVVRLNAGARRSELAAA